ncbi:uncharacterized protein TNCV_1487401 [Trichonephila clavipes]|nr:uncharacterized protein TNCV_1487401 [Trichonephila clavipes]
MWSVSLAHFYNVRKSTILLKVNNNNERSKDPSNADGMVRTTIRGMSYSTTAAEENQRPCSEKTTVNCGGGDRGRVAIYRPFGEVSLNLNRTVTCMVLKANDRRTSCPCHDEFRGPRSDYVRQETFIAQNVRLPSTEAFRADKRLYEGYGDWAEKGRLVVSSNRSRCQPRCVHGASPVAKMVGAGKCGTFEGSRGSQSDVSKRESAHPPPSGGSPTSHVYLHSSVCVRLPECSNIDQNDFPVDWLKVACTHGVRSEH